MEKREMRPFIISMAVLTAPAYSQASIGTGGGGRPSEVNAARAAAENAEKRKARDKRSMTLLNECRFTVSAFSE
jgi:hypothetical protein